MFVSSVVSVRQTISLVFFCGLTELNRVEADSAHFQICGIVLFRHALLHTSSSVEANEEQHLHLCFPHTHTPLKSQPDKLRQYLKSITYYLIFCSLMGLQPWKHPGFLKTFTFHVHWDVVPTALSDLSFGQLEEGGSPHPGFH